MNTPTPNPDNDGAPGIVSIVIPTAGTRNQELREAIMSALSQSHSNVEVLVVSDGWGGPQRMLEEINDPRLVYIEVAKHGEPTPAREAGVRYARGKHVIFLDDDDVLYQNHVQTLLREASDGCIPFARAMYVFKRPGMPDQRTMDIEPGNPSAPYYQPAAILSQNIAPINCFMVERRMHYAVGGFDKNLIRLEDWDYWGRLSMAFRLKPVKAVTSEVRINLGKTSRSFRWDVFRGVNVIVGDRVKERLSFLAARNSCCITDEARRGIPIPKVSVIMPVYNAAKWLDESISSIMGQTFQDFELIAIDDGSTDQSRGVMEKYSNDKRVRIFRQANKGVTKTLNFGLSQAIGYYIARMDADDVSMPERLAKQVEFMDKNHDVALLGTRFQAWNVNGSFIENLDVELTNEELQPKLLESCRFGHPTIMMRRTALEEVGPYDESPWAYTVEDYDLWLRLAERFKVANLPDYLLKYRVNPNSITQTKREVNRKGTLECIRRAKERRGIKQ